MTAGFGRWRAERRTEHRGRHRAKQLRISHV